MRPNLVTPKIDHLVVTAPDLDQGCRWLEARLGTALQPGGRHDVMGTHNRLLRLGDLYLEVISIDPSAPKPSRKRWFDLDAGATEPRLSHWVLQVTGLATLSQGRVLDLQRGDLRWSMALPEDQPGYDAHLGALRPALIEWHGKTALDQLAQSPCRCSALVIEHPMPEHFTAFLPQDFHDPRLSVTAGQRPKLTATIETATGSILLD